MLSEHDGGKPLKLDVAQFALLDEALESGIAYVLARVLEGGHTKELEHPVGQDQPVIEFDLTLRCSRPSLLFMLWHHVSFPCPSDSSFITHSSK